MYTGFCAVWHNQVELWNWVVEYYDHIASNTVIATLHRYLFDRSTFPLTQRIVATAQFCGMALKAEDTFKEIRERYFLLPRGWRLLALIWLKCLLSVEINLQSKCILLTQLVPSLNTFNDPPIHLGTARCYANIRVFIRTTQSLKWNRILFNSIQFNLS